MARFHLRGLMVLATAIAALALPGVASGTNFTVHNATGDAGDGTMSPAARQAQHGALTLAADDRVKARATVAADGAAVDSGDNLDALAPSASRSWEGVFDTGSAPSDSTGAIGITRYIETVNRTVAIYSKTSNTPLATGTLNDLFGQASTTNSFDPQVIWDPGTNRFYYAGDSVVSASDNRLSFGFSKTATPSNATTSWCHYWVNYGSSFPDYPKLGDSSFFIMIGVNTFGSSFLGSDLVALSKPAAGTTCPAASTFKVGVKQNIANSFTPVAVNQIDSSPTGYYIARNLSLPSTVLRQWRVTRNATTGNPVFSTASSNLTVPSYTVPAQARQRTGSTGSTKLLDTLDSRPTQAVSGLDPTPARVNNSPGAIWVQHTTNGGVGAEVRWYEIDPSPLALVQSGKVTSSTLYNFNGAISPNRAVNGATKSGGDAMVLGYDASGTTLFPQVRMVSKIGTAAQSGAVAVRSSLGNYNGFDCAGTDNNCRWGDYGAASPEPNPPTTAGRVWLTSQYASGGTSTAQANWRTWNWAAAP
jgi:hypothetical protein